MTCHAPHPVHYAQPNDPPAFLASLGNPNTVRSYGIGVGKTAERIGEGRPLASVADDEVGEALELLWGTAAVNTWAAGRRCCSGSVGAPSISRLGLPGPYCLHERS